MNMNSPKALRNLADALCNEARKIRRAAHAGSLSTQMAEEQLANLERQLTHVLEALDEHDRERY